MTIAELPKILPAGRPIVVQMETSNHILDAAAFASSSIQVTPTPTNGQTLIITWATGTVTFTFKTSPTANGTDLPLSATPATLLPYVKASWPLTQAFNITVSGSTLVFTAKQASASFDISTSGTATHTLTAITTGQALSLRPNFKMLVDIIVLQATDLVKVGADYVVPNTAGKGNVDISEYLWSYCKHYRPVFNQDTLTDAPGILVQYQLATTEAYGSGSTTYGPVSYHGTSGDGLFAIMSKIQGLRAGFESDLDAFRAHFATRRLAWWQAEYNVTLEQPQYLYQLLDGSIESIKLVVQFFYTDGTDSSTDCYRDLSPTLADTVICVPVGLNVLASVATSGKVIQRYTVALAVGQGGETLDMPTYTYHVKQATRYDRYFLFLNSLGAFEVLHCFGSFEYLNAVTREQIQNPFVSLSGEPTRELDQNSLGQIRVKADSGLISADYAAYLGQELADSDQVYEIDLVNQRYIPIRVDSGSLFVQKDRTLGLRRCQFDYSYAFTNGVKRSPLLFDQENPYLAITEEPSTGGIEL